MIYNKWYIVCFERELKRRQPVQRKILGQDVVAFRTASGRVAVLEDRCCHRNVQLSLGKVSGESIKCGYHGWEYGTDGRCTCIPSLPEDHPIPGAARIRSYPAKIRHKAVWAFFGEPGLADNVRIPPLDHLDDWPFIFNYHIVEADLEFIAESLYDPHHINHVHSDSIGAIIGDLGGEDVDYHIETTSDSMHGWYYRANRRNFFEKIYFGFKKKMETYFSFWFPHTSILDLRFPKQLHFPPRNMVIYQHYYQVDAGRCMIIQITAWRNIFRFNPWFARWFMSRKSKHIVEEDIQFLESSRSWHRKRDLQDLLVPADKLSFAFRRLWNENMKNETERTHPQKTSELQDSPELN